jgi:hypothetical protein
MKTEWAAEGYGNDQIEVWAAASVGMIFLAQSWLGSSTSPAFEETLDPQYNASASIGAGLFNIVVLDRNLVVQKRWDTVSGGFDLEDSSDRAELDTLVRSLL